MHRDSRTCTEVGYLLVQVMDFTLIPQKSALRKFWSPKLTFTGTSVMGVNPANGAKQHGLVILAYSASFAL